MTVSGLVFIVLLIMALIMLALFLYSIYVYRKDRMKSDLQIAKVLLVVVMILLGLNILGVQYDSIRYEVYIESVGASTVILPIPNEQELIDEVMRSVEGVSMRVVESERGQGLEITLNSYLIIKAEVFTRMWSYDHDTDLVDGDDFLINFEPIEDNATLTLSEIRIIQQNPLDFHSKQIVHRNTHFVQGWNRAEYERAT